MGSSASGTRFLQREVLLSLLVIGFAASSLSLMTWAYFADADASEQNAIQAGTLDLTLDGKDSLTTTFSITNGTPASSASHNYTVRNNGSLAADHLEITFSFNQNDSRAEPSDSDLNVELNATETATLINVTRLEYQNENGAVLHDVLATVNDGNANGIVDLDDVRTQSGALDDLTPPQPDGGNRTFFVITVAIANDDDAAFIKGGNTAGNLTGYDEDIMADGVDVTLTFTLNQDASQ